MPGAPQGKGLPAAAQYRSGATASRLRTRPGAGQSGSPFYCFATARLLPIPAANEPENERPIAVLVSREGLGDTLLKLPLLRAIARGYPGRPIWWLASYQTAAAGALRQFLPAALGEVREFVEFDKPRSAARRRFAGMRPFSLVFDTRSSFASVYTARRHLRCNAFYCCLPGYLLSSARPANRILRPRHIGERAFSLAEAALGAAADGSGRLMATEAASEHATKLLPEGPLPVGLALGSREARKNWPQTRFLELADLLKAAGMTPVLLLGPKERDRAETLRRERPDLATIEFLEAGPGISSLDVAIAVLSRLSAVVANDSGLGHLAGAAGRPVVSLFGPTDPRRWAPMAPQQRILSARDHGGEEMERIPPDAVLAAVREILQPG